MTNQKKEKLQNIFKTNQQMTKLLNLTNDYTPVMIINVRKIQLKISYKIKT